MVLTQILIAALVLLVFNPAPADAQTTRISTEYLMTLYAPLDPPQRIDSQLVIYNVRPGGWVKGPRINGMLIAPAADWVRVMPDGSVRNDVRATIRTNDGALIYITYNGIVSRSREVAARLAAGKVMTSADEYFVTAPTMETSSETYAWLNHVHCVGKMVEVKLGNDSYVKYDIFIVR